MDFLRYNTSDAVPYDTGQTVKRVTNCNGFTAVNTGDELVFVNDQPLFPGVPNVSNGESLTVGGNLGEIFLGNIKIRFAGGGANPQVMITQKFYIIDKQIF